MQLTYKQENNIRALEKERSCPITYYMQQTMERCYQACVQSNILVDVSPRRQRLIKKLFTKKRGAEAQKLRKNKVHKVISRVSDIGVTQKIKHQNIKGAKERIVHKNMLLNCDATLGKYCLKAQKETKMKRLYVREKAIYQTQKEIRAEV